MPIKKATFNVAFIFLRFALNERAFFWLIFSVPDYRQTVQVSSNILNISIRQSLCLPAHNRIATPIRAIRTALIRFQCLRQIIHMLPSQFR
jgi:hypothetical protein